MNATPRNFVDAIGGYRVVAVRLGVSAKTMHAHANAKRLPPKWYAALCDLATEEGVSLPQVDLFDFKPLLMADADEAEA